MENLIALVFYSSLAFLTTYASPVPQTLTRLQPVPENYMDWPDPTQRQLLTAMDHAVMPPDQGGEHGDLRQLLDRTWTDGVTEGSFPGAADPGSSIIPSSSWSSLSTEGGGDEPDLEAERMVYGQLYRHLSGNRWGGSFSLGSQSASDPIVFASLVDQQGAVVADSPPPTSYQPPEGSEDESLSSFSSYSILAEIEGDGDDQL